MDNYGCLYMYVHACTLLQACYVSFYNIPICMLSAKIGGGACSSSF